MANFQISTNFPFLSKSPHSKPIALSTLFGVIEAVWYCAAQLTATFHGTLIEGTGVYVDPGRASLFRMEFL